MTQVLFDLVPRLLVLPVLSFRPWDRSRRPIILWLRREGSVVCTRPLEDFCSRVSSVYHEWTILSHDCSVWLFLVPFSTNSKSQRAPPLYVRPPVLTPTTRLRVGSVSSGRLVRRNRARGCPSGRFSYDGKDSPRQPTDTVDHRETFRHSRLEGRSPTYRNPHSLPGSSFGEIQIEELFV